MRVNELKALPWALWRRQVAAILRLEWKKSFFAKRALWIYLLALGPVAIALGHSLLERDRCPIGNDMNAYAAIFQVYYLRLGIFFGCVGIFSNAFRGEVLEKTLHYYFLTPVRREVLVAAKYFSGLLAAVVVFGSSAVLTFLFISMHNGPTWWDYVLNGPGLEQLTWYAITTVLACVGYGAVFLLTGLVIRNPMIPAAVVMVWENLNPFLPPLLKKFSVIFYLKSLCPVEVPVRGPAAVIAVVADPTPAWLAIPGLLAVSAAILIYAALRSRELEVSYSE